VVPVHLLDELLPAVAATALAGARLQREPERFRAAVEAASREIRDLRELARRDLGEAEARIFDVQLMILQDPDVGERTVEAIRAEKKNAEFVFCRIVMEFTEKLESLGDGYFSERAIDLLDVRRRVLSHLTGQAQLRLPDKPVILVGRDLAPSDAVGLDPRRVLGFVTDQGGVTGHATIMARARGIPAVVGVRGFSAEVEEGETVAVDGIAGRVVLRAAAETLAWFRKRRRAYGRLRQRRERASKRPAETRDGHHILLGANVELPRELESLEPRGAQGIGLFRTEFFFMIRHRMPSEDEQVETYRKVIAAVGDEEVIIRVLDVGGDKVASYLGIPRERNPYLGMRGIRYLLSHPKTLETQLRAILRAAVGARVGILFPMVSSVGEFAAARNHTRRALAALKRRGVPHDPKPRLGVMIEVPSTVMLADEFARTADFFSIGSNDLIQYLLAVDRDHQTLHDLYRSLHPAVLRSIRKVADAAHRGGIPVSVCGEMAGDLRALPLLLGLGIDRLSVSSYRLPEIKQAVRTLKLKECQTLARDALTCSDPGEVEALVASRLGSRYANLLHGVTAGEEPAPSPGRAPRAKERS